MGSTHGDARKGNAITVDIWDAVSRDWNKGTHGSGEERELGAMWPRIWASKEGEWQSNAQRIRVDATERNARTNEWISCTFTVCIDRLGAVLANPYRCQYQVPGGLKMIVLTKQILTTPLRTVLHPEPLEELKDDIQQEQRVQPQHPTESLKALNDGFSTRRYVCRSLVGTTTTTGVCIASTTSTFSLQQSINLKCPTTLTTIIYQVPRNY